VRLRKVGGMEQLRNTLELENRGGRLKYRLAGRLVSGGDIIDLCFSGGWVTGRFEWNGDAATRPSFHYSIALAGDGRVHEDHFPFPEGAIVRWPLGTLET
jgi:hypothetical protein